VREPWARGGTILPTRSIITIAASSPPVRQPETGPGRPAAARVKLRIRDPFEHGHGDVEVMFDRASPLSTS
jgi:hypothetical protein